MDWQDLLVLFPLHVQGAARRLVNQLWEHLGLTDLEAFAVMPAHELAQIFQELPPDHPWRLPPSPDSVNNMLRTASGVLARAVTSSEASNRM